MSDTLHTSVAPMGWQSIRVRIIAAEHDTHRLDVRSFHAMSPGAGFNVAVRHLPAIRAAIVEAEEAAERLGLLRDEAA